MESSNIMMFSQQAVTGIVPVIGMERAPPDFFAKIVGSGNEHARAMSIVSSVSQWSRGDDSEVICGAVMQIAEFLAAEGRLLHEILAQNDDFPILLVYFLTSEKRTPHC